MTDYLKGKNVLGINGLGRIGKLTLWNHLAKGYFDAFVINVGRQVGKNLNALVQILEQDSTYGSLEKFLYGYGTKGKGSQIVDPENGILRIEGRLVKILMTERNPAKIPWQANQVRLVVDCTGVFSDPLVEPDSPKGSLRGHLESGAEKVILSAPFKVKDQGAVMPSDTAMFVYGINHLDFDPAKHHVISAASCTTTGLAHMMKPLLDNPSTANIMTASMSTIHASTNTQSILDSVPKAGAGDLRKNRSIFNNIILTSTGAAKALEKVLPEIQRVGFMADSVRIPTNTASLISLNITVHSPLNDQGEPEISREFINAIYKLAAEGPQKGMLEFSERQNVSADMIGMRAATVIEGIETHCRTGFFDIKADTLQSYGISHDQDLRLPVSHVKIFGWYDNELGSYTHMLGELTVYIAKNM
ncbi:MAG: glyceraldehyde 3-phosphate dehydrogenase NAD-binding domain-containing protein [Bacteroidales bacterium]|jgi:glyceraldehyde 3-phosphate dehydrogenase|nr:hypothetical protein [Bacteroidales bacterium]MDD2322423.1 glyceraldehyde 3-phosphate dehydrogenase NAD-binding domain-containing protein [Bacteroidales bacterium]MDD3009949.1 glyceraldehyde 3-phosphate dehydrogenase NAD-binding domain-containing protein [Bacteroidales bacterium]MDD3960998.1 glyceraldehyde 3-phosphate dehydrogenase NAD-binding domain-containing protein [Bacteroidales bacterium]MDY0284585.1 glyceraldehyde 3-phosphate dehydrogenase NAD-binding domain-containing protein [Bacter